MEIGFMGLGNMGMAMARSILKAGHKLTVYNRSPGPAKTLKAEGARIVPRPAALGHLPLVLSMLANDDAVSACVLGEEGLHSTLTRGSIHVSMSTIGLSLSRRMWDAHRAAGQHYVAAPVFGRPEAAARAALFVVAAGAAETLAKCQDAFSAIGQKTFVVGTEPPTANLIKLSGNFLLAAVIEGLSEAMALVEKAGVDRAQYVEILTSTLFAAPAYKTYGALLAQEVYEPAGFAVPLGLKDIRLTLAAAEEAQVPMPLASLIRDQLISALARGYEQLDWAVLGRVAQENAGIGQPRKSRS
jgi:3-hydroxyisobutyrate dehydrogenase-like beta-hydroxyacid dehydrogenase